MRPTRDDFEKALVAAAVVCGVLCQLEAVGLPRVGAVRGDALGWPG
jgi:hypothetical protein